MNEIAAAPVAVLPHPGSRWRPDGWLATALLVALLVALPVLAVFSFLFQPATEVWRHLAATVLQDYIANSLWLMLGVAVGVTLIGVPCAWLTSVCEFPGRRWLEWALLLPLAMPAYIIAYTYTGLLDFAGPVQTGLRDAFGWRYGDYWFPSIRSLGGAIVMFSLVLYPYVYMLVRAAFLAQSRCALEASRTLGAGPWRGFFRVALPLARPALVTGISLALMETLADYGTVSYFGISTFTTGIFRTWYGLGDAAAAAQLAALLMLFIFVLIATERWSRRRARYHHTSLRFRHLQRQQLGRPAAWSAAGLCLLPLLCGFIVPGAQLAVWAWSTLNATWDSSAFPVSFVDSFIEITRNSFLLAAAAASCVLLLALLLGYARRLHPGPVLNAALQVAGIGYAVPGAVIAIGVMLPFAAFDNTVDQWLRTHWGVSSGLLLSGTLIAVLFAYAVRFLAIALQTVEAGLGRVRPSMDDAARSLGLAPRQVLARVHLPLLRGSLLTALVLVFVDVLKELPATLILRPFNFNTLAVRTFELASDERLAEASLPALAIVLTGLLPVYLLSRAIARAHTGLATTGEPDAAAAGH